MASRARETVKTVGLALLLGLSLRVGVAQAYVVEGPSMEPTIVQPQRLFVLRAAYGLSVPFRRDAVVRWADPGFGDVVVIESPADGMDLVKRVVGLPGDVIEVRGGLLVRNGVPLEEHEVGACEPEQQLDVEPDCRVFEERAGSLRWNTSRADGELDYLDMGPVTVPDGHVFVMGDHRDRSNDSRAFGAIPMSRLRGRVLFID
ncbi:MAG: signal peptidase I [Sandaracinaceae bacterium]